MPGRDNLRKKGKDKRKETFKRYGKNTAKGMRIKQEKVNNQLVNSSNQLEVGSNQNKSR